MFKFSAGRGGRSLNGKLEVFCHQSSTYWSRQQGIIERPPELGSRCFRSMASGGGDGDDDEDLRRAIKLSLEDGQGVTAEKPILLDDGHSQNYPRAPPLSNGSGFLGLNRKQMELDRLSRKRKASSTPQPPLKTLQGPTRDSTKRSRFDSGPTFLQGVVKRTWAPGSPQSSDIIKLEEVLEKDDLQLAVLSSFQWDIPWLFAKINMSKTLVTLIMQAKDEASKEQYRRETAQMSKLRICFPSMQGQVNCMHSKLMLLSHKTYLRVVVPTANLVSYDWGETGAMENMCFIIDLPRLSEGKQAEKLTFFGEELFHFLEAQGLEKSIVTSLYKFDFSHTKGLAFVHTIGGVHVGPEEPWRRTGFCGLGRAVKKLGLDTNKNVDIDFVTSSVGSLNLDFLSSLYLACQGDDGTIIYGAKAGGNSREVQVSKQSQSKARTQVEEHFRIYFPTNATVRASIAGTAGTICFQSKWYNSPTFPKSLMRDCQSKREGLLMHNKIIYVSNTLQPWAYVGSANCSESAWGSLSKDRALKIPKLNCRNWECGVLIPTTQREKIESHGKGEDSAVDFRTSGFTETAFDGVVPVPMVHPSAEYGSNKPWYYSED